MSEYFNELLNGNPVLLLFIVLAIGFMIGEYYYENYNRQRVSKSNPSIN